MWWRISSFLFFAGVMLLPPVVPLAQGESLQVVATHSILADVVRAVAGDRVAVSSLIPAGADAHGFIPTPRDLTTVAEAELVIINGAGFEEGLLQAVESAGEGGNIVNASACIEIRPFGAGMHQDDHVDDHADDDRSEDDHEDDHADDDDDDDHAEDDEDDDADDHHAADDHDDEMAGDIGCDDHDAEFAAIVNEEADGHAHFETLGRGKDVDCLDAHEHGQSHLHGGGACDPHLWMDPHNVIYWVLMIRDTLSAMDRDNAEAYAANSASYAQELVALEADFIVPALADLAEEKRVLITSHESLGYFATTFGFEIITTVVPGMATMVEPSARDVAAMVDLVRDERVPAIFSDRHLSDVLVKTIAGEAGLDIVGLYSDSLSDGNGEADNYIDYMHYNVTAIIEALKGEWK